MPSKKHLTALDSSPRAAVYRICLDSGSHYLAYIRTRQEAGAPSRMRGQSAPPTRVIGGDGSGPCEAKQPRRSRNSERPGGGAKPSSPAGRRSIQAGSATWRAAVTESRRVMRAGSLKPSRFRQKSSGPHEHARAPVRDARASAGLSRWRLEEGFRSALPPALDRAPARRPTVFPI